MRDYQVTNVPIGGTAVLNCTSNDDYHNFMYWLFGKHNVIGPNNQFDSTKYKYEVLSGRLHISNVMADEAGMYRCVSQQVGGSAITVKEVEMVVTGPHAAVISPFEVVSMMLSIIVIISCAVIYYRLRREWSKYEGRSIIPADDMDDDDGDGDEIYNRTTTAITQPVAGPSRNLSSEHLLDGIDNQGLDTDFNSVFENIQIKSPIRSLI